jgi:CheY-like chemotaxis protein
MSQPLSDATVLVVDDDDDVRAVAVAILRELGYDVIEASGGAPALDLLRRGERVDLLFTDLAMPGINGIELAHRAVSLRPALKVLYTSAYVRAADSDPALRHGPVIEKPWVLGDLREVLATLLGQ